MKTTHILLIALMTLTAACKQTKQHKILAAGSKEKPLVAPQDAMAAYRAQQHRFEIKACKLYYNDQQVVLDSLHLFEKVMGDDYLGRYDYFYEDKPLSFRTKNLVRGDTLEMVISIAIKLSDNSDYIKDMKEGYSVMYKKRDTMFYHLPTLKGAVLIDGQLVNADTKINDFNQHRRENKLPLFDPLLGMIVDQGITYDISYCKPAYNGVGYTDVTLYYNDENEYEKNYRATTIREVRYNYEQPFIPYNRN